MFSRRSSWDRTPNALSRLLDQRRRVGSLVVDLTESNPTRCGFVYPEAAIREALSDPRALTYAPEPRGHLEAREAVARHYRGLGVDVDSDRILLTASTSEAYSYLFRLLCDPGDRVLVPAPSYPLFDFLVALDSLTAESYALGYDGTWHVDLASLRSALGPRTRAVLVVSPHNPTGMFLKHDELAAIETACAASGAALVCDEVFADYGMGVEPTRVVTSAGDRRALTFSLGGLSKMAALPQLKLGWICASGPEPERREAMERLEVIADTFLSVNTPVQVAAARLMDLAAGMRSQIVSRVGRNRDVLVAASRGTAWQVLASEGGWYAVLEVPRRRSEEEWTLALLGEHGVLVHPGFFFDFPRPGYVVASLLPPEATFDEGVARLRRALA